MDFKDVMLILQYLAIAILFAEFIFAVNQSSTEMQKNVIVLTISCILMFVGYNIEMTSDCLETALMGVAVAYIGKPFIMLYSFTFICSFYQKKIPKWLFVLLNFFCTLFCILVFSNQYHYLYYGSTAFDATQAFSPLILTHGPCYYLYVLAAVVYFFSCIIVVVQGSRHLQTKIGKRLNVYIVLMCVFGIGGYAVFLLNLSGGYDATVMGVLLGVLCLGIMFTRYHIFDSVAMGKDLALDDSPTGLLVFDCNGNVSFTNTAAKQFLTGSLSIDYINRLTDDNFNYINGNRALNIITKQLSSKGQNIGKAVEITDISELHGQQRSLEKQVAERTEKLANIQREIIGAVANIIEARSLETGEHIKRTSEYSAMIARYMMDQNLYPDVIDEAYVEIISSASSLHDIGKIAVPDYILLKPGKLTEDELDLMKTHVSTGAEIILRTMSGLESEDYVRMCADIARYHHERWDGQGYLAGLSGEEIPLSARIVAVADCFDALINERVYKEAYSMNQAMELLKKESGAHFDPMVVFAFESALRKRNMISPA